MCVVVLVLFVFMCGYNNRNNRNETFTHLRVYLCTRFQGFIEEDAELCNVANSASALLALCMCLIFVQFLNVIFVCRCMYVRK